MAEINYINREGSKHTVKCHVWFTCVFHNLLCDSSIKKITSGAMYWIPVFKTKIEECYMSTVPPISSLEDDWRLRISFFKTIYVFFKNIAQLLLGIENIFSGIVLNYRTRINVGLKNVKFYYKWTVEILKSGYFTRNLTRFWRHASIKVLTSYMHIWMQNAIAVHS